VSLGHLSSRRRAARGRTGAGLVGERLPGDAERQRRATTSALHRNLRSSNTSRGSGRKNGFPRAPANGTAACEDAMNAPREVYILFGALGGVLIVATFIGAVLLRRSKDSGTRAAVENLNARIIAWWGMILVAGGACLVGRPALIVLFAVISF